MDLINILKERVTPTILTGDSTYLVEKSNVLANFYPILLALLKKQPELIQTLQSNLNPRLSDIFSHHLAAKDQLLQSVNLGLPQHELEDTLNHSIAPTLGVLGDLAGSDNPRDIQNLLEQNSSSFMGLLPVWATTLLGTLGISTLGTAAYQQAAPVETNKKSGFLLPIIALLILAAIVAFLFKQCRHQDVANITEQTANSASSVSALNVRAAELRVATGADGQLLNCQALVGSSSLLAHVKSQISTAFGKTQHCDERIDAQFAGELTDQNAMNTVFSSIKGIPNIAVAWVGNQLTIQAPELTQAQKIADQLKAVLPNMQLLAEQSVDHTRNDVAQRNDQADAAMSGLHADQATGADIIAALNLQVINFATGSAEIPSENKVILDKAAKLLKQRGEVQLLIKGFTDNVGQPASNKVLSEKRAQSVLAYLKKQGVNESQLSALGLGEENPVADNSTKEGQFKNRRIEFSLKNINP